MLLFLIKSIDKNEENVYAINGPEVLGKKNKALSYQPKDEI